MKPSCTQEASGSPEACAADRNAFYGVEVYRPSDQCPYVEKVFVRMLVPRDRATDSVHFIWRPVVPPYTGRYFE